MSSFRTCCVGSLTRLVTLIVIIQCCLVLIYITFIQSSSWSPHPSRHPRHPPRLLSSTRDSGHLNKAPPGGEGGRIQQELRRIGMRQDVLQRSWIMNGPVWHRKKSENVVLVSKHDLVETGTVNVSKSPRPVKNKNIFDDSEYDRPQPKFKDSSVFDETVIGQQKVPENGSDTVLGSHPDKHKPESGLEVSATKDKSSRQPQRTGSNDLGKVTEMQIKAVNEIAKPDMSKTVEGDNAVDDSHGWQNLFADSIDIVTNPAFPDQIHVPEDRNKRLLHHQDGTCLVDGTLKLTNLTRANTVTRCVCREGWHGPQCSIPDSVLLSEAGSYVDSMTLRSSPRRIINAMAFNIEFELLEARLHELGDTVDLYIFHESNFTSYGDVKPLRLLQRLRKGYLKQFHHKFLYLYKGTFPEEGRSNGWVIDKLQRTYISEEALKHIRGLRADDIFMYNDADEIPSRDALLFLKMHDGYPEPFGFSLRWSVFGFYWKQAEATRVMTGCSLKMLQDVFHGDIFGVRSHSVEGDNTNFSMFDNFVNSEGFYQDWYLGEDGGFAGWHCSWCLSPEGIRVKLKSAINADFPRWGNFPEKLDLSYIRRLIVTGTWFDDQTFFNMVLPKNDKHFAPQHMFQVFSKFQHLLDPTFYTTSDAIQTTER